MLNCPFRCCNHIRRLNAAVTNNSLDVATYLGQSRNYNKDKGSCCKDVTQTEGKQVEQWPKSDPPPPAWRNECPRDPQPPNYDPYRIKVPDVVVPPLPPSNAKWMGVVFTTSHSGGGRDQHPGYSHSGYPHQHQHQEHNAQQNPEEQHEKQEDPTSEGFFGYLRSLFGRGKGKAGKDKGQEILSEDSRELFNSAEINFGNNAYQGMQDLFRNSPIIHPDYWKEKQETKLNKSSREVQDPLPKLGYHGKQKYKYAFHEPWKPLDRITLLAQAEKEEFGETDEESNFVKTDEQLT